MKLEQGLITKMDMAIRKAEKFLNIQADEVSILFEHEEDLNGLVFDSKMKGLWFNSSIEHQESTPRSVSTTDREDEYETRYEFIHPYIGSPWRIEAMYVREFGFVSKPSSPLHYYLLRAYGDPCIAHVSWKVDTEEDYEKEILSLESLGLDMFGEYRNSYGLFSYWNMKDSGTHDHFFLKPRVNLRD